jgi:mannitol operon transcriptional antiterminator
MYDSITVSAFSPRLVRLLELLLRSSEPVKIDVIAGALNASRRTVFRELENARPVLSACDAGLISIQGKGIAFSGSGETRQKLLGILSSYNPQPISKRERLLRLLIELVANAGAMQKLLYYANVLDVSESTVSHDLDELETWLSSQGLTLVRKSGLGVRCDGSEESARTALVSRFMLDGDTGGKSYTSVFDFPGADIESGVRNILRRKSREVDWMTSESLSLFAVYLMVMVERVYDGKIIAVEQTPAGDFQTALAEKIAAEIAEEFSLVLPETERLAIAGWIQSCRSKQDTPLDSAQGEQLSLAQSLAIQMIDRFDPPTAAVLKTNEQLTQLLSRHLESALYRLKSGKFLPNPLEKELIENYPEVYEKTKTSVEVLEEYLGVPVPSNEVSFIQIHFLAALAFLGDRHIKRRLLRAGIVCVSGIGASYMLSYQVRKRFKGELEVEVADYADKSSWASLDFLISTVPLEKLEKTEKPFIWVQTILGEKDYQKIRDAINAFDFRFTERKSALPIASLSFEKQLDSMIELFMQSRKLLDNFSVESIKRDCSFDELILFASRRFSAENPDALRRALSAREAVSTQVVSELRIVLLHTRSVNAESPVFAVIVPSGGVFTEDYFKRAESCVLMLLPENAPKEMTGLMGGISSALLDIPSFLEAVRAGNRETIKAVLEREIAEILARSRGETS